MPLRPRPMLMDDAAPKPKRPYTVSEKVLAANRANLEKARAAPRELRFRRTERRAAAARANLVKARVKARERALDPTQPPCAPVQDGSSSRDLRRTAPLVGEDPAQLDRTVERMEQRFRPESQRERNGIRGLGEALWRCRRVWQGRAHRELLLFYLWLTLLGMEAEPCTVRYRAERGICFCLSAKGKLREESACSPVIQQQILRFLESGGPDQSGPETGPRPGKKRQPSE